MPPLEYPASRARLPVPTSTTPSIIWRMVIAFSGLSTRTGAGTGSTRSPRFNTRRGLTSNPPLAMTDAACASCSVVTLTSWPMDTEARDVLPQRSSLYTLPGDSPGSGNPVFCPKPKRVM